MALVSAASGVWCRAAYAASALVSSGGSRKSSLALRRAGDTVLHLQPYHACMHSQVTRCNMRVGSRGSKKPSSALQRLSRDAVGTASQSSDTLEFMLS